MREKYEPTVQGARELRAFIANGERRDMETGGAASAFVSELFTSRLFEALKAYDQLFDPDVTTEVITDSGAPIRFPQVDDVGSAAANVGEPVSDSDQDPTPFSTTLPIAETWSTGIVKISVATLQDSGVDLTGMLASAFAPRFGRGIGPEIVTALLAGAKLGQTAGKTSVSITDLIALRKSVDPSYRATPKCAWVMNDNTLAYLDDLTDLANRPIFDPNAVAADGRRLLYGYPVAICPSMADIGASAKPIAFGALGYLVVRKVKDGTGVLRMGERFMDALQIGFRGIMRANSVLLGTDSAQSPVKYIANAAA